MSESGETVMTVEVSHEEELAADGFDLFVTVRGASVFTGRSAIEKAAEVKTLVGAVVAAGVTRSDVSLVGVQVDVESGLLSKSSSARYSLRIRSGDSERLARVLSAIALAKNATVDYLEWRFPEGEAAKQEWLRAAVTKARGRADAMAEALGMTVDRVKLVNTPLGVPGAYPPVIQQARVSSYEGGGMMRARRGDKVDLGLEVAPTKKVEIGVRVEFLARPRVSAPG